MERDLRVKDPEPVGDGDDVARAGAEEKAARSARAKVEAEGRDKDKDKGRAAVAGEVSAGEAVGAHRPVVGTRRNGIA
jgi:hypothetical protein